MWENQINFFFLITTSPSPTQSKTPRLTNDHDVQKRISSKQNKHDGWRFSEDVVGNRYFEHEVENVFWLYGGAWILNEA